MMIKYNQLQLNMDWFRAWCVLILLVMLVMVMSGCELAGGMMESYERTKIVDVNAEYLGLDNHKTAVLIDAPMDIQYEHSRAVPALTEYITLRLASHCPGSQFLPTRAILAYQNQNVYWPTMDYHDLAKALGVERIVFIDLSEYRLFSPGNSYYWDGQAVADVNVFEAESPDSTTFAFTKHVVSKFPPVEAVSRSAATEEQIDNGLKLDFTQRTAWLFYNHQRKNSELQDEAKAKR